MHFGALRQATRAPILELLEGLGVGAGSADLRKHLGPALVLLALRPVQLLGDLVEELLRRGD